MEGVVTSPRISFATDLALFTTYDPAVMKDWIRKSRGWVYEVKDNDFGKLEPVRAGRIAVWPLGGKGGRYTARVLHGELPEPWRVYEKGKVTGFGLRVESGQIFLGPGERIPGDGFGDRIVEIDGAGKLVDCPVGRYVTTVHVLDWKHDDKFFGEDGEANDQAPPDLAVVLTPHEGEFTPPCPCPALLEFLPKIKHKPVPAVLPRPVRSIVTPPPVARPSRGPRKREDADWKPAADPLPPPKPGEIRIGMLVRHAQFGEGHVLFIREGFPKVKVDFRGRGEEKVDRSELPLS